METQYTEMGRNEVLDVELTYYLTESSVEVEGAAYTRYGAELRSSLGETAAVRDVFGDRESAQRLVAGMCRGAVTPAAFADVVRDALYAREFPAPANG